MGINDRNLYIDDFVKKQGFNFTEEYIENCIDEMRPLHFDKVEYFNDLLKKGILSEWFFIRTSDAGRIDRTYKQ